MSFIKQEFLDSAQSLKPLHHGPVKGQTLDQYRNMVAGEMAGDIETAYGGKGSFMFMLGFNPAEEDSNMMNNLMISCSQTKARILQLAASKEELHWDPNTHVHGIFQVMALKDKEKAIRNAAAHIRFGVPNIYQKFTSE